MQNCFGLHLLQLQFQKKTKVIESAIHQTISILAAFTDSSNKNNFVGIVIY